MNGLSRRHLVWGLGGLATSAAGLMLLGGCGLLPGSASAPARVRRIGFLSASSREALRPYLAVFLDGLRDLGWVEGQNLSIEWRFADGRNELLPELATDLVRLQLEVIVAYAAQAALPVQQQTRTIPIVFVPVADPVAVGLVASLARPGGNATGVAGPGASIYIKGMEFLTQLVHGLARLAVMADLGNPVVQSLLPAIREAAQALAVQVQELDVRGAADLDGAFAMTTRNGANALLFVYVPTFLPAIGRIVELAAQSHLPAAYQLRDFVEAGGLLSYAQIPRISWMRAASYVDKILRGAKPGDLPVEQSRDFELLVNVKTARALGLTIPPDVAAQVTEWIQ